MSDHVGDLLAKLRRATARSQQILATVHGDAWELVVYEEPYPWTVRDLLAHLVSAEEGLLAAVQDVVAGGQGAPGRFDYEAFNASEQERLADVAPEQLLSELGARRAETISWVAGLEEGDLRQVGRHPALGRITVRTFIKAIYGHQLMHMRDLTRILT